MNKFLLSIAFLLANISGIFSQIVPADYDNDALNRALNDSINMFYTVKSHKLQQVAGVELIDSSLLILGRYNWPAIGLYKASYNTKNEFLVDFNRAKGDTLNYSGFSFVWAGWGQSAMSLMPRKGLSPFPFIASGTATQATFTPALHQDTLYGYSVNLKKNPEIRMTVRCTKPTNIRVDLIDKNYRWANVLAPHHRITTINKDTTLVFRWDYRPLDSNNNPDWKFEDYATSDFNIGIAADGHSNTWWGVNQGRAQYSSQSSLPIFGGRFSWAGAAVIDCENIVGIAITLEDGNITTDHTKDYGYSMLDSKTLTIKNIFVGSATNFVDLTGELTHLTKITQDTLSHVTDISPDSSQNDETTMVKLSGKGKPFAHGISSIMFQGSSGKCLETKNITIINDSTANALLFIPYEAPAGKYTVTITTDNNSTILLEKAFIVTRKSFEKPKLLSVTPQIINHSEKATINIKVDNPNPYSQIFFCKLISKKKPDLEINLEIDQFSNTIYSNIFLSRFCPDGEYDLMLTVASQRQTATFTYQSIISFSALSPLTFNVLSPATITQGSIYYGQIALESTENVSVLFKKKTGSNFVGKIDCFSADSLYSIVASIENAELGVYDLFLTGETSGKEYIIENALTVDKYSNRAVKSINNTKVVQGDIVKEIITLKDINLDYLQTGYISLDSFRIKSTTSDNLVQTSSFIAKNDSLIFDVIPGKSPIGLYQIEFYIKKDTSYYSNCNDLITTKITTKYSAYLTIVPSPSPPLIKNVTKVSIPQWEQSTIDVEFENAQLLSSFNIVRLTKGDTIQEIDSIRILNNNQIKIYVTPNRHIGFYNLSIRTEHNLFETTFTKDSVLQIIEGKPYEIKLENPIVLNQGQATWIKIPLPDSILNIFDYNISLINPQHLNEHVVAGSSNLMHAMVKADVKAGGTYDISFSLLENSVLRKFIIKNSLVIEDYHTPDFQSISPNKFLMKTNISDITIVYKNGIFQIAQPKYLLLIKDDKIIDTVSPGSARGNDTIIFYPYKTFPDGRFSLKLIFYPNDFLKELNIPTTFTVINPDKPYFESVSPRTKEQNGSSTIRIQVANGLFKNNRPSTIFFTKGAKTLSTQNIRVVDEEILDATFTTLGVDTGMYDMDFSFIQSSRTINIKIPNALEIIPSLGVPQIVDISPSSVKEGTIQAMDFTLHNFKFSKADICDAQFLIDKKDCLKIIRTELINDSIVRCYVSIPTPIAIMPDTLSILVNDQKLVFSITNKITLLKNPDAPHIANVENNVINQGDSIITTINCEGFNFSVNNRPQIVIQQSRNSALITSNNEYLNVNTTIINENQVKAFISVPSLANTGYYDIFLIDNNITYILVKGIVVNEGALTPKLSAISNKEVTQGQQINAIIKGENLLLSNYLSLGAYIQQSRSIIGYDSLHILTGNSFTVYFTIPENADEGIYDFVLNKQIACGVYNFLTLKDAIFVKAKTKNETAANMELHSEMRCYPTVTHNQITIEIPTNAQIEIVSAVGVTAKPLQNVLPGENNVDVSNLQTGLYYAIIITPAKTRRFPFLKQ